MQHEKDCTKEKALEKWLAAEESDDSVDNSNSEFKVTSKEDKLRELDMNDDLNNAKDMLRRISSERSPSMSARNTSKSSNTHFQYASTAYGVRLLSRDISNTKVELDVQNMMIITKLNDISLYFLTRELVEWLLVHFPSINVYVDKELEKNDKFAPNDIVKDSKCRESRLKYWTKEFINENDVFFDLVVTLGGDGTVLFVSSLFQRHVPPVMSFSLGSLGFLTNFKFENFRVDLARILNGKVKTNLRMRLECKVYRRHEPEVDPETGKKICVVEHIDTHHILNEVTIDRGPSPFISNLELYGDGNLMTVAQADGLIVASPTGSTAYSLSAGGSLIYPSVNAIAVTPICPHTLSFRPIILPDTMTLKVKVALKARGTAWAGFDGKDRIELKQGDFISIANSPYVFPTVESTPIEFIDSISRTMNWNVREQQKSFTHILSQKNKDKYNTEKVRESKMKNDEEDIEERKMSKSAFDMSNLKESLKEERSNEDEKSNDDEDETADRCLLKKK